MNKFKGFYKKDIKERTNILKEETSFNDSFNIPLDIEIANHMVENVISTFELPMGIAPGFLINNKYYQVPMVTEESSVIAAASKAAKIIAQNKGFSATVLDRTMRGEIVFANPNDPDTLISFIQSNKESLFSLAKEAYPSIVKRGGGVTDFKLRTINNTHLFIILDVFMDTKEAMGANMMNTVLEHISQYISDNTQEVGLMSILSNLTTECIVEVTCSINPESLDHGHETAQKIAIASDLAKADVYRATTHNKGIMNGIDAIVIASGNDTRAINAGVHAYASLTGTYQPLATWEYKDEKLLGTIRLPMAVGSVGGSISINPKAKLAHSILNLESSQELMTIIGSVGLAQNFAALYALTTDGIQKGHMGLHAQNLALNVGTPPELMNEVTSLLRESKVMNLETAKEILNKLKKG